LRIKFAAVAHTEEGAVFACFRKQGNFLILGNGTLRLYYQSRKELKIIIIIIIIMCCKNFSGKYWAVVGPKLSGTPEVPDY
jgi:hypothetical protein